jgi:Amt family ammonium transporter
MYLGITPAAGYVSPWSAAAIGLITAGVVALFQNVNKWLHIDDGLAVFKLHAIGGMVGAFLTGCFATSRISALDGLSIASGAIDGHGIQIGYQLAEICAISSYSFVMSVVLLMIIKYIPGLHLRVSDEVEDEGYDLDQFNDELIGEWGWDAPAGHHQAPTITEGISQGSGSVTPTVTEETTKETVMSGNKQA